MNKWARCCWMLNSYFSSSFTFCFAKAAKEEIPLRRGCDIFCIHWGEGADAAVAAAAILLLPPTLSWLGRAVFHFYSLARLQSVHCSVSVNCLLLLWWWWWCYFPKVLFYFAHFLSPLSQCIAIGGNWKFALCTRKRERDSKKVFVIKVFCVFSILFSLSFVVRFTDSYSLFVCLHLLSGSNVLSKGFHSIDWWPWWEDGPFLAFSRSYSIRDICPLRFESQSERGKAEGLPQTVVEMVV